MKLKWIMMLIGAILICNCNEERIPEKLPAGLPVGEDIAIIETGYGEIFVDLDEINAPKHAENFKKLVREEFYEGTKFHKIIPEVFIMGGDPLSKDDNIANDGKGGTGYTLSSEIGAPHCRGALAAARISGESNPNKESNGCQFYICLSDLPKLDSEYTVFGQVVSGIEVVEKISLLPKDTNNHPMKDVSMKIRLVHTEGE